MILFDSKKYIVNLFRRLVFSAITPGYHFNELKCLINNYNDTTDPSEKFKIAVS